MSDNATDNILTWLWDGHHWRFVPLLKRAAENTASMSPDDEMSIEQASGLHDHIDTEHSDSARTLIESGEMGNERLTREPPKAIGNGLYTKILRAAVGDTEQARAGHLRSLRKAAKKNFPEFALWKHGSPAKREYHKTPPHQLLDKDKQPSHLTKTHVIELYSAISFANSHGVVLNAHVSIRWDLLELSDHQHAADVFQEQFLRYLNQWYKDTIKARTKRFGHDDTSRLHWIYVHECPPPDYCFHTHLLVGVPLGSQNHFAKWANSRINDIYCGAAPKEAINIVSPDCDNVARQWHWFNYICKGLDPKAKVKAPGYDNPVPLANFIREQYLNPGPIKCWRRIGISQNLRSNERKMASFQSEMELGRFDDRTLYTPKLFDTWRFEQQQRRREQPDMSEFFNRLWAAIDKTSDFATTKTSDFNPFSR